MKTAVNAPTGKIRRSFGAEAVDDEEDDDDDDADADDDDDDENEDKDKDEDEDEDDDDNNAARSVAKRRSSSAVSLIDSS